MKRYSFIGVAVSTFVLAALMLLGQSSAQTQDVQLGALSSALHVLPPLGENTGDLNAFDQTLTDFLTVTVCEVESGGGCKIVIEFTSQKNEGGGLDYIKLQNHHYHVNWDASKDDVGREFGIHFAVAGLEVGFVRYTPPTGRTVPIKFRIDNHPRIRARVLHEQGYTATEIAEVLRDEFGLGALETAQILSDEGYEVVGIGEALRDVFGLDALGAAQILKDVGFSAVEVGQALRDVFSLDALGAAQILKDVGFSTVEVGQALRDVFGLDALGAAQILKELGYSVVEIYDVLTEIYGLSDIEAEDIFASLDFDQAEYMWITAGRYVNEYAPVLKFDGHADTFPMDAQKWFEEMLCGDQGGPPSTPGGGFDYLSCQRKSMGWGNSNVNNLWLGNSEISTLEEYSYKVPTYCKVRRCGPNGQLRIEYWWFYGYQEDADHGCGQEHPADWEHIMVTTSEDRQEIAAITYYQHAGRYTRIYGYPPPGWKIEEEHPVVYVGKTAHGSYHDSGGSGTCLYYEDWRNPHSDTIWFTWETPLVNLDGNEQDWLWYDKTANWDWGYDSVKHNPTTPDGFHTHVGTHPTVATSDLCAVRACEGKGGDGKTHGCWFGKSDCRTGDCWCGDSRCSHDCSSCVAWEEYQKDYWIPTSDSGIIVQWGSRSFAATPEPYLESSRLGDKVYLPLVINR